MCFESQISSAKALQKTITTHYGDIGDDFIRLGFISDVSPK